MILNIKILKCSNQEVNLKEGILDLTVNKRQYSVILELESAY